MKQLERWKERKALEKEKEKRERERKGVFKTGVYHHKDGFNIGSLPVAPGATKKEVRKDSSLASYQCILMYLLDMMMMMKYIYINL